MAGPLVAWAHNPACSTFNAAHSVVVRHGATATFLHMYTEYTLGVTDLVHISADVMRYRNTIIRALEADRQKDFERITESLPA